MRISDWSSDVCSSDLLSSLVAEQLVVAEGQRGIRVASISAADLLDLTDARVLLARETVRRAIERADTSSRAQIMSAFHRLDRVEAGLHKQNPITGECDNDIGRGTCRERVSRVVYVIESAVAIRKKNTK